MSQRRMTKKEVAELQSKIDQGIRLAQKRLWERAMHDDLSLVVNDGGQVREVPARELQPFSI